MTQIKLSMKQKIRDTENRMVIAKGMGRWERAGVGL